MTTPIDRLGRWWLTRQHGMGAANQYQFYRCVGCQAIVTWQKIRTGGCGCGEGHVKPAILSRLEKLRLLVVPWAFQRRAE